MIILGVVLLVVGLVAGISILTTLGMILMVAGAILWILGASGRAVGGLALWTTVNQQRQDHRRLSLTQVRCSHGDRPL